MSIHCTYLLFFTKWKILLFGKFYKNYFIFFLILFIYFFFIKVMEYLIGGDLKSLIHGYCGLSIEMICSSTGRSWNAWRVNEQRSCSSIDSSAPNWRRVSTYNYLSVFSTKSAIRQVPASQFIYLSCQSFVLFFIFRCSLCV